jgi:hypothetical protein
LSTIFWLFLLTNLAKDIDQNWSLMAGLNLLGGELASEVGQASSVRGVDGGTDLEQGRFQTPASDGRELARRQSGQLVPAHAPKGEHRLPKEKCFF